MHRLSTFVSLLGYQIWTSKSIKRNRFRNLSCKRFLVGLLKVTFDDVWWRTWIIIRFPRKSDFEWRSIDKKNSVCVQYSRTEIIANYWKPRFNPIFAYSGGILKIFSLSTSIFISSDFFFGIFIFPFRWWVRTWLPTPTLTMTQIVSQSATKHNSQFLPQDLDFLFLRKIVRLFTRINNNFSQSILWFLKN